MLKQFDGILPKNGVVLFSAPWCKPCKVLKPIIEAMPEEVIEINVDENSELANHMGVQSVPALVSMLSGSVNLHLRGLHPKPVVESFVRSNTRAQ